MFVIFAKDLQAAINRPGFVYPGECDLMVHPRKYTALFSHECILLPLYVYNMHQDTKSIRLIAVCQRSLTVKADFQCCGFFLRISLQTDALCRESRALSIRKH